MAAHASSADPDTVRIHLSSPDLAAPTANALVHDASTVEPPRSGTPQRSESADVVPRQPLSLPTDSQASPAPSPTAASAVPPISTLSWYVALLLSLLLVCCGGILVVQSAFTVRLAAVLSDSSIASLRAGAITLSVASCVAVGVLALLPFSPRDVDAMDPSLAFRPLEPVRDWAGYKSYFSRLWSLLPPFTRSTAWQYMGGYVGCFYLIASLFIVRAAGYSIFAVTSVAGQMFFSALLDWRGWLGFHRQSVGVWKLSAIALTVAGSLMLQEYQTEAGTSSVAIGVSSVAGFVAGWILPIQAGCNTSIGRQIGHALPIVAYSFATGALLLVVIAVCTFAGEEGKYDESLEKDYQWFGASLAVAVTCGITILSPLIGVAPVFACIIAGSLLASVIFDSLEVFALPGTEAPTMTAVKIAGVCVAMIGALLLSASERLEVATKACCKSGGREALPKQIELLDSQRSVASAAAAAVDGSTSA